MGAVTADGPLVPAKLERRAERLLYWQGKLDRSVDRMFANVQTDGQPLPVKLGKLALAFGHINFNMLVTLPLAVSSVQFANESHRTLGAEKVPDPNLNPDGLIGKVTSLTGEHLRMPNGRLLEARQVAQVVSGQSARHLLELTQLPMQLTQPKEAE